MSFTATQWLSDIRGTKITSSERSVLFMLADMANDMGHCWPSHRTLADKLDICAKQVTRVLRSLARKGLLIIEARTRANKSKTSNRYILDLEDTRHLRGVAPDIYGGDQTQPLEPSRSFSANATKEATYTGQEVKNSEVQQEQLPHSLVINTAREAENEQPSEFRGLRCDRGEAERPEPSVCGPTDERRAGLALPIGVEAARGVLGLQRRPDGANPHRGDGAGHGEHALRAQREQFRASANRDFGSVESRKTATVLSQSQRAAFIANLLPHLRFKWAS